MSAGARVAVVAGGAVVLAVLGYFGLARAPEPPPVEVAAPEVVAPAPKAAPAESAAAVAPEPSFPALDVVRVTPEGSATVAGKAEPGAAISLRVDGTEVLQVTADDSGNFVALFDLVASEMPRLLSVVAIGADGAEVAGKDTVALAPILPKVADADAPAVLSAPAAILVSPEGVKVLQPVAEIPAEVAGNVFVDTISYTADGAVQLGGHGKAGGALRVYLDAAAVAETAIGADGIWSLVLGDVAPGVYTLRVDQLAVDGSVSSRFETPFKRETLEALAAASTAQQPAATPAGDAGQVATAEPIPATVTVDSAAPEVAAPAPAAEVPKVAASDAAPVAPEAEQAPTPPAETAPPAPAGLVSVTVQPGYTLWGIAKEQFGSGILYVQVFDANREKIKNPDLIYPGQIFLIPGKH